MLLASVVGGHVPVGALLTHRHLRQIFNQMDRAVVHGSTFANDLAMASASRPSM
jgi:ornithine--oxo-acid transaminase